MKQVVLVSTTLSVLGVLLMLFGAMVTVSYTTREPFRVDGSKTLLNESFTLYAHTNKTYFFDSLIKNSGIIQVYTKASDAIGFKIIDGSNDKVEFSGGDPVDGIGQWESKIFWTPPTNSEWRFVYDNPFTTSRNATVIITEFYFKMIEYKEVTHYLTSLDSSFAYIGIIAIIAE